MRFVSVPADAVAAAWPVVCELLAASCRRAGALYGAEDLRAWCESAVSRLVLAVAGDGRIIMAGVAAIGDDDGVIACHIQACAGVRMREWLPVLADLERWAAYHGAAQVRFSGRPGWLRVIPGYRAAGALYVKDLAL